MPECGQRCERVASAAGNSHGTSVRRYLGKHASVALDPCLRHSDVFSVEFDPDGIPAQPVCHKARGECSRERVEDGITSAASGLDAPFGQFGRERGEVSFGIRIGGDCPKVAGRPLARIPCPAPNLVAAR